MPEDASFLCNTAGLLGAAINGGLCIYLQNLSNKREFRQYRLSDSYTSLSVFFDGWVTFGRGDIH
jgi:hypothetical protein